MPTTQHLVQNMAQLMLPVVAVYKFITAHITLILVKPCPNTGRTGDVSAGTNIDL